MGNALPQIGVRKSLTLLWSQTEPLSQLESKPYLTLVSKALPYIGVKQSLYLKLESKPYLTLESDETLPYIGVRQSLSLNLSQTLSCLKQETDNRMSEIKRTKSNNHCY